MKTIQLDTIQKKWQTLNQNTTNLVTRLRTALREKWQAVVVLIATVESFLLMCLAAHHFRPGVINEEVLEDGLVYMFVGGMTLGVALFFALRSPLPPYEIRHVSLTPRRANWLLTLAGALMIGALAESSGHLLEIQELAMISHHKQFYLLTGGVFLIVWGLSGGGLPFHLSRYLRQVTRTDLMEVGIVLALMGLALGLRIWELEYSVHHFVDELNFGTVVAYYWGDKPVNILEPLVRGFPAIYPFLQNETVELWGRNLTGLRMTSVIFGVLTIPAIYLLARALFDWKTALIAALFLAVFPPHIQFSRLALNNIADPFFATLAMAFLARGLRYNHRFDFAVGGAALGLTQYFYEGGRLLFPPLVALWMAFGLLAGYSRPRLHGLITAALAAAVIAAPIYYTLHAMELPLTTRLKEIGQKDDLVSLLEKTQDKETYSPKIKEAFKVYVNQPEYKLIYYGGKRGLILVYLFPLALLGLFYAFWHPNRPAALLVFWILLTSFGNSLLQESDVSARYAVAFPALALLMAVGLRAAFPLFLPPSFTRRYPRLFYIWLLLFAAIIAIRQVNYFYGPHLRYFNNQFRQARPYDAQDALFRAAEFPEGTHVHLVGEYLIDPGYARGILGFLKDGMVVNVYAPEELPEALKMLPPDAQHVFFIPPFDETTRDTLETHFELSEPELSPFDLPYSILPDRVMVMYKVEKFKG